MKKEKEYIPQFDIGFNENESTATEMCIGCEKVAAYLDENGYCSECADKLKAQPQTNYKSALKLNTDSQPKPFFTILKTCRKMIFLILSVSSAIITTFFTLLGNVEFDTLLTEWVIAIFVSYFNLIYINDYTRNIKMLKNMKLFDLAQSEAPATFKTVDNFKLDFVITENFLYIRSSSLVIPVKFIEGFSVNHSRKRGYYLSVIMYSGKSFKIAYGPNIDRYIDALLRKNPNIIRF